MTLSNRKYASPLALLENIYDEKGNKMKLGDEEDVGEIGSRFMNALKEAFKLLEPPEEGQSDSSSQGSGGDTEMEDSSNEEEEKVGPNTRMDTRQIKIHVKQNQYGPRALGKELFKDPQDRTRGFINNLFFGKKIEITEQGARKEDTVAEDEFFQIFLSVLSESKLYDAWDSAYHYTFDDDDKKTYKKRNYILSLPDVLPFQLMRATYDFDENRLKKVNSRFEFDTEIYVDRFLYQNCEKFKSFREKVDAMEWNKAKLESTLSSYSHKGLQLDEFFSFTKKVLFDQINKDQYDDFEEHIPSETDICEVLPPDAIGTLGMSYQQINSTIDCLSEYETKIRENIDKQTLYIHKLRNEIEKAYKESTEYPYVLHAVIIHEGEALSGHYYSYVKDHLANCWYKFNDHRVKKMKNKEDQVLKEAVGENARSAYFLVYINQKHVLPKKTKKKSTVKYYERFIKGDKDKQITEENNTFMEEYLKAKEKEG